MVALNACAVARMILSAIGRLCSRLNLEAAIANGALRSTTVPFCIATTACRASFSLASRQTSLLQLIPAVTVDVAHQPGETSPVPSPTFTASHSPIRRRVLRGCFSGSTPLPWPSLSLSSSAPSRSPSGANISTLQDSLDVAGYCFAPPPRRVTSLQHIQLPGCIGCLLRGPLAVTTTGLAPVSKTMTFQGTRATCYALRIDFTNLSYSE